jgi:hypothetical protein
MARAAHDLQDVQGLQHLAAKVRPPNLAVGRLLPVVPALREILPSGGLQRGATVVIDSVRAAGATTLALELLAGPSVGGYWCAIAGGVELGLAAAAERGIDLARLLLVPSLGPPDRWLQVVATLFDSVDVVLLVPRSTVRQSDARRLAARSRERESVFLVLDPCGHWQGPSDLRCTVTRSEWSGLGCGFGLLTARRFELEVSGRGAAARPRRAPLQLPA